MDAFSASIQSVGVGLSILVFAIVAICSYLLGCFNGAVIVSKYVLHDDVRNHGSGNAGLTNFHRTFGGKLAAFVIVTDMLKAVFAVLIGSWIFSYFFGDFSLIGQYYAGLCCLLGHVFPCMFHFKGGKGVLSGGAIALMIDWKVALIVWGGFFVLALLTKFVSLGSIYAGCAFPFATWLAFRSATLTVMAIGYGALLVWGHRANIGRLLRGEESKFSLHHKTEGS